MPWLVLEAFRTQLTFFQLSASKFSAAQRKTRHPHTCNFRAVFFFLFQKLRSYTVFLFYEGGIKQQVHSGSVVQSSRLMSLTLFSQICQIIFIKIQFRIHRNLKRTRYLASLRKKKPFFGIDCSRYAFLKSTNLYDFTSLCSRFSFEIIILASLKFMIIYVLVTLIFSLEIYSDPRFARYQ